MKLFDLYIFKNILQSALVVLLIFLALLGFLEFIAQADDVGVGTYGVSQAIQYSLLKLPSSIFQLMPIIVLIGSLLALGNMSKNSELLVLLTSGFSLQRMSISVFFSGIVLCFFTASIGEYISPKMERYADQYRTINKYQYSRLGNTGGIWLREGDKIININLLNENKSFGNVSIYQLAENNKLSKISRASSAGIDDFNQWILSNLSETVFNNDGITGNYSRYKIEKTNLNRDLVNLTIVKSEDLNIVELYRFINYLDGNELDSSPYRTIFHSRVASLLAIPIMCLLALPFSLGFLRKKGIGYRIILGIMIGLVYFLVQQILAESAAVYNFEPFLVGWSPTLLLIILVFSLFRVIRQEN
jgi:lipopolysaccharide export system permease protein